MDVSIEHAPVCAVSIPLIRGTMEGVDDRRGPKGLCSLPNHLLVFILDFLDSDDLQQVRRLNRRFRWCASMAVKQVRPYQFRTEVFDLFPNVMTLDLRSLLQPTTTWSEMDFLRGIAQARRLTSLVFGANTLIPNAGARAIGCLHSLRSMELLESRVSDTGLRHWSGLTSLTSLSLRACVDVTDYGLSIVSCLHSLEEVDFGACHRLGDETLAALATLPRLKKLDLASCDNFTVKGLTSLRGASALRTLLLAACWQINDEALITLADCLPNLECLSLFEAGETASDVGLCYLSKLTNLSKLDIGYAVWGHTSQGLAQLIARLPNLLMLNIGGAEGVTDQVVDELANLKHLTSLDISECQRVTSKKGMKALRQLPSLLELSLGWNLRLSDSALMSVPCSVTKLDLSYCGELSDDAFNSTERLTSLQALIIRRCSKIGDRGLEILSQKAPNLRYLDISYTGITSTGARDALPALTSLSYLALAGCARAATVLGLNSLARVTTLQHLDASNNPRLDDGCMQAVSFIKQLKHLAVRGCPRVTDRGLMELVRLKQLTCVEIGGCRNITHDAVERLRVRLPLLLKIRAPCEPAYQHFLIEQHQQRLLIAS